MLDRIAKIVFYLSGCFLLALPILLFLMGWVHVSFSGPANVALGHLRTFLLAGKWQAAYRFVSAPDQPHMQHHWIIHRDDLIQPGYRLIVRWNGEFDEAILIDKDGVLVHSWNVDYHRVDPAHNPSATSPLAPHGVETLSDGSLLVNYDFGRAMARFDKCSNIRWKKEGHFHHSITPAEDGSFWTWQAADSGPDQYMLRFDPADGRTIEKISLIKNVIERSSFSRTVFGVQQSSDYAIMDDWFHPNDVEPLPGSLAGMFPLVAAGDLMISMRNLDLVAIVGRRDHEIKWYAHGPWRYQHDPDFMPNGNILVYNNNTERVSSNLVEIDPISREARPFFQDGRIDFYAAWAGKQQLLPRGSVLIVVPYQGRVLEASRDGELIAEYNNLWTHGVNGYVSRAKWLPGNYFTEPLHCETLFEG